MIGPVYHRPRDSAVLGLVSMLLLFLSRLAYMTVHACPRNGFEALTAYEMSAEVAVNGPCVSRSHQCLKWHCLHVHACIALLPEHRPSFNDASYAGNLTAMLQA